MSDTHNLDQHDQMAVRREKLKTWRSQQQAFPQGIKPSACCKDILEAFKDFDSEQCLKDPKTFTLCGRIRTQRIMGKASFVHLQDHSDRLQLYLRKQDLNEGEYDHFKTWDLGDIIAATGYVFRTKSGEISLHCKSVQLLSKCLHPMPDKFHGLEDVELRYRQRYLDLIYNQQSKEVFKKRSCIIQTIREVLLAEDFAEVETPMMHPIAGGALAKPFVTHHHALDMQLFMRIAPELYLKRLLIGGLDRVFEINRNFRNEGISTKHNPEFTELEFYQSYADYHDLILLTESMLRQVCERACGNTFCEYQGQRIDFGKSFKRMSMRQAILENHPQCSEAILSDPKQALDFAKSLKLKTAENLSLGHIHTLLFEETCEKNLIQPTFITEYPVEISPLARRSDDNPAVTDRFELFIAGYEVANGFSELNDPEDQAERFHAQAQARASGDDEAMYYDADYVKALEYGLPPCAGEGIGIDRLLMILTDSASIRDVIFFPQLKPSTKPS
jgi:lysyl-tRNA synthetase, class II